MLCHSNIDLLCVLVAVKMQWTGRVLLCLCWVVSVSLCQAGKLPLLHTSSLRVMSCDDVLSLMMIIMTMLTVITSYQRCLA